MQTAYLKNMIKIYNMGVCILTGIGAGQTAGMSPFARIFSLREDLKAVYNNYFLQVQTLINQKAIEAPGNKKKWYKFW